MVRCVVFFGLRVVVFVEGVRKPKKSIFGGKGERKLKISSRKK